MGQNVEKSAVKRPKMSKILNSYVTTIIFSIFFYERYQPRKRHTPNESPHNDNSYEPLSFSLNHYKYVKAIKNLKINV